MAEIASGARLKVRAPGLVRTLGVVQGPPGPPGPVPTPADIGAEPAGLSQTTSDALSAAYGRGVVNIQTFDGVDPTGATDSTVAINQAIAGLPDDVQTVVFPPGRYVASIQVTKPNLTLRGESWNAIIQTPSGATRLTNDAAIRVFADGVTIENIQIDGNRAGNPALDDFTLGRESDGIGIYASDVTVRGCYIHDTIGHKTIVWNEAFTEVPSIGTGSSVNIGRRNIKILGNTYKGAAQRAAVDIASTQNAVLSPDHMNRYVIVANNIIEDQNLVCHGSEDIVIVGNQIRDESGAVHGIDIHHDANRVLVTGNVVGPAGAGIWVIGTEATAGLGDITITGNTINGSVGTPINVDGAFRVAIDGNQIDTSGSGAPGVSIKATTNATVRNNTLSRIGASAILVMAGSSHVLVASNKITSSSLYGVDVVNGTNVTISGNHIQGGALGVVCTTGTNDRLAVTSNTIDGPTGVGAHINAANSFIQNNAISNTGSHGIRAQGANALIRGNVIRSTGSRGIYTPAAVAGIVIADNYISGAASLAIDPSTATSPIIRHNVINGAWVDTGTA